MPPVKSTSTSKKKKTTRSSSVAKNSPVLAPLGAQALLVATWQRLKAVWPQILVTSIIFFFLIALYNLFFILAGGTWFVTVLIGGGVSSNLVGLAIFFLLTFFLTLFFIQIIYQTALLLVVARADQADSSLGLLQQIKRRMVPALLASLVVVILTVGGLFFFIVPGLVFAFLLMFVLYEVVLEEAELKQAVQTSVQIVRQNLGQIIQQWLVLLGLGMAGSLIGLIISKAVDVPLLSFFISILLGWFSLTYWYFVYRDCRRRTNFKKETHLVGIYLMAGLGWLAILSLVIIFSLKVMLIKNLVTQWLGTTTRGYVPQEFYEKEARTESSLEADDRLQYEQIRSLLRERGEQPKKPQVQPLELLDDVE